MSELDKLVATFESRAEAKVAEARRIASATSRYERTLALAGLWRECADELKAAIIADRALLAQEGQGNE